MYKNEASRFDTSELQGFITNLFKEQTRKFATLNRKMDQCLRLQRI